MTKQELIDELKNILNFGSKRAITLLEQLNEPVVPQELEKPVVPQFVADFYESIKDDFENKVYDFCVQFYNENEELNRDVWWWFGCAVNKPIETLVMMHKFGYEVKKEKLYTVEIPNPNSSGGKIVLLRQDTTGKLILNMLHNSINLPTYLYLTEQEIKKDFAWAWQFAKEVEECNQER